MAKYKKPDWKPNDAPNSWNARKEKKHPEPLKKSSHYPWSSSENVSTSLNHQGEFSKKIKTLAYSRPLFEVWNDFVMLASCAISNAFDRMNFEQRENLYMRIISKYRDNDRYVFTELLTLTVDALEKNPDQDFLGSIFIELGLANKHNGQYFTPYDVAKAKAEITLGDVEDTLAKSGAVTIHDSCCGSGALLIASINVARKKLSCSGINFQNVVFVSAQDIDPTVAAMCYIQLSLHGVAGHVKVGNALVEPVATTDYFENYWFTPMYFSDVWRTRRTIAAFMDLIGGIDNEKI